MNKEKTDTESDELEGSEKLMNELEKYNLLHKDDEFPDTPTDELDLENETDTKIVFAKAANQGDTERATPPQQ